MTFYTFFKTFMIIFAELTVLFIGISFLVSWLQQVVPEEKIKNILSHPKGWRGYLYGAGLGSLTPFCSCSTVPILAGLLSSKAPFGPSMSFLIASPLLNPVIVILFFTLLGWKLTRYYVFIVGIFASLMGVMWNVYAVYRSVNILNITTI